MFTSGLTELNRNPSSLCTTIISLLVYKSYNDITRQTAKFFMSANVR